MQKSNKVYKDGVAEKWRCPSCSFDNLALIEQCEMCETPRVREPRRLDEKQPEEEKQVGIECPSAACKHFNSLTNQFCGKCGKPLFQEEPAHIARKPSQKKQAELIHCRSCNFPNDPLNLKCVSCDKKLVAKKIPRKSAYSRRAGYGGWGGAPTVLCPTCNEPLRLINHLTGQTDPCMECEERHPTIVVKTLCIFCDKKLTRQDQATHDEKCQQRIKFYKREGNTTYERCTDLQVNTMIYMHKKCEVLHYKKEKQLIERIKTLGYKEKDLENLHHYIMHYAPIIIHMHVNTHFHFFLKDTHYRNQFQTSMSSGSLSHSARTGWENRMFDRKHHGASGYERVKYGTMNFTNDPSGVQACLGYGQSYFLLKSHVRDRCTITDMDSSSPSATLGTFRFIFHLLMKLSDAELKSAFEGSKGKEMLSNVIGAYKEIQIHGPVEFIKDIQRVYVCKEQLKLGDAQALLEQVKSFCAKNNVDYELFEKKPAASAVIFGGPLPVAAQKVPQRLVGDKKQLTEEDLRPPPPPVAAIGGGFAGGFGGGFAFGSVAFPAFGYPAYVAPAPLPVRPPPKPKEYGIDYI